MKQIHNSKELGEIIRTTRRAQGIDQASFALICGFSERPMKAIESGQGTLSVDKVLAMFDELGIKLFVDLPSNDN